MWVYALTTEFQFSYPPNVRADGRTGEMKGWVGNMGAEDDDVNERLDATGSWFPNGFQPASTSESMEDGREKKEDGKRNDWDMEEWYVWPLAFPSGLPISSASFCVEAWIGRGRRKGVSGREA